MSQKKNFRLQSVLNYKTGLVDNLETEFAKLRAIQKAEEDALTHLEEMVATHSEALHRQQEEGTLNCETIELHQKYLAFLHNHTNRQRVRVAEATAHMNKKRDELVQSMQEQKTLEKLKSKHNTREALEASRREARIVDDLVNTRYAREGYSHA